MSGLEYQIALLDEALASLDVRYHCLSDVVMSDLLKTLANTTAVVRRVAEEQRRRIQDPQGSPRALLVGDSGSTTPGAAAPHALIPVPSSSLPSSLSRRGDSSVNPFANPQGGAETLESISAQLGIPLHRIRELNPHMAAVAAGAVLQPNTFVKLPREAMQSPLRQHKGSVPRQAPARAPTSTTHATSPHAHSSQQQLTSSSSSSRHNSPAAATQPASLPPPPPAKSAHAKTFTSIALGDTSAASAKPSTSPPPAREASRSTSSARQPSSTRPADRTPTHQVFRFVEGETENDAEVGALTAGGSAGGGGGGEEHHPARRDAHGHDPPSASRSPSTDRAGFLLTPASVRSPPPANAPPPFLPPPPRYRPDTAAAQPIEAEAEPTPAPAPAVAPAATKHDAPAEPPAASHAVEANPPPVTTCIATRGRSRSHSESIGCAHSASAPRRSTSSCPSAARSETELPTTTEESDRPAAPAATQTADAKKESRATSSELSLSPDSRPSHGTTTRATSRERTRPTVPGENSSAVADAEQAASQRLHDVLDEETDDVIAAAEEGELVNPEDGGATPGDRRGGGGGGGARRVRSQTTSPAASSQASGSPSPPSMKKPAPHSTPGAVPPDSFSFQTATSSSTSLLPRGPQAQPLSSGATSPSSAPALRQSRPQPPFEGADGGQSPEYTIPPTLSYFYAHAPPPALENDAALATGARGDGGAAATPGGSGAVAGANTRPPSSAGADGTPTPTTTLSSTRPLRTTQLTNAASLPKGAQKALQALASTSAAAAAAAPARRTSSPLQLRNLQQPSPSSPTSRSPTTSVTTPTGSTQQAYNTFDMEEEEREAPDANLIPPPPNRTSTSGVATVTVSLRGSGQRSPPSPSNSPSSSSTPAPPALVAGESCTPSMIDPHAPSPAAAARGRGTKPSVELISPRRTGSSSSSSPAPAQAYATVSSSTQNDSSSSPSSPSPPPGGAGTAAAAGAAAAVDWSPASPETAQASPGAMSAEATSPPPRPSTIVRGFTLPAPEDLDETRSSSATPAQAHRSTSEAQVPRHGLMNMSDVDMMGSPAPASAPLRPQSQSRDSPEDAAVTTGTDTYASSGEKDGDDEDGENDFDTINTISASYGVPVEDILLYNDFLCAYELDEPLPADLPITLPVLGGGSGDDLGDEAGFTEL